MSGTAEGAGRKSLQTDAPCRLSSPQQNAPRNTDRPSPDSGNHLSRRNRTSYAHAKPLDSPNGHSREISHEPLSACLAEMRGKLVAWSRDFDALLKELAENPDGAMIGQLVIPQSKSSVRLQPLERYLPTLLRLSGAIQAYIELEMRSSVIAKPHPEHPG